MEARLSLTIKVEILKIEDFGFNVPFFICASQILKEKSTFNMSQNFFKRKHI